MTDPLLTPEEVRVRVGTLLKKRWTRELIEGRTSPFTEIRLCTRKSVLEGNFARLLAQSLEWPGIAAGWGCSVTRLAITVAKTSQNPPRILVVPDVDAAARVAEQGWPHRLEAARARSEMLQLERLPHLAARKALQQTDGWTADDVDRLARAAAYVREHAIPEGMSARQVPIPHLDSKWLERHESIVALVAGVDGLGLDKTPGRIHFTYLDEDHLAAGGRRHDSFTVGDTNLPAYRPRVVVICENKTSVLRFPQIPGGIAVEGDGKDAAKVAAIEWIREAPSVVYWGDMDADGYAILNLVRRHGLPCASILMDMDAYQTYAETGTDYDKRGNRIKASAPALLPHLTPEETAVHRLLLSPSHEGHRRVEQERIPPEVAAAKVAELCERDG